MKKILLLFALILTTCISYAQSPLNLAAKLGANYSIVNSDFQAIPDTEDKAQFTYSIGALARLKIKKLSFQAEALYVTKQGEVDNNTNVIDAVKIKFATFDFPVLVGYKIADLKVLKIRANAGVIPSIVASKANGDLDKDSYKDAYFSAAGGLSVDIPLFLIDLRYQHGLGDFYEISESSITNSASNNLVTLSVAYKFL